MQYHVIIIFFETTGRSSARHILIEKKSKFKHEIEVSNWSKKQKVKELR